MDFQSGEDQVLFDINDLTSILFALPINRDRGTTVYLPFMDLMFNTYCDECKENPDLTKDRPLPQFLEYVQAVKITVENDAELLTSM